MGLGLAGGALARRGNALVQRSSSLARYNPDMGVASSLFIFLDILLKFFFRILTKIWKGNASDN